MKKCLLVTAIATCLANTAVAGVLDYTPVAEPEMIAPAVTDWSGPYAGVMYAMGTGTLNEYNDYFDGEAYDFSYDLEGDMYGVFAGYNFQRGSLVFGIEGAYSTGSVWGAFEGKGTRGYEFTSFTDLKARAGVAAGNALIYGFAGGTLSDLTWSGDGDAYFTPTGINYGAGIDLLVTDGIFIGAEYIVRKLSDDLDEFEFTTMDATVNAVQIRTGMNF